MGLRGAALPGSGRVELLFSPSLQLCRIAAIMPAHYDRTASVVNPTDRRANRFCMNELAGSLSESSFKMRCRSFLLGTLDSDRCSGAWTDVLRLRCFKNSLIGCLGDRLPGL